MLVVCYMVLLAYICYRLSDIAATSTYDTNISYCIHHLSEANLPVSEAGGVTTCLHLL